MSIVETSSMSHETLFTITLDKITIDLEVDDWSPAQVKKLRAIKTTKGLEKLEQQAIITHDDFCNIMDGIVAENNRGGSPKKEKAMSKKNQPIVMSKFAFNDTTGEWRIEDTVDGSVWAFPVLMVQAVIGELNSMTAKYNEDQETILRLEKENVALHEDIHTLNTRLQQAVKHLPKEQQLKQPTKKDDKKNLPNEEFTGLTMEPKEYCLEIFEWLEAHPSIIKYIQEGKVQMQVMKGVPPLRRGKDTFVIHIERELWNTLSKTISSDKKTPCNIRMLNLIRERTRINGGDSEMKLSLVDRNTRANRLHLYLP